MAEGVGSHYSGERGAEYAAWQAERTGSFGAKLKARAFQPHVGRGDRVLDFGCGGGDMLAALRCGEKVGVEPNDSARAAARAKGLDVVGSVGELEDASFDTIVSNHALEHALDPHGELLSLRAKLRPGGRLVIRVPIEDWRSRRQRQFERDPNHHLYTWTPLLFRNLLNEAGFDVEECRVVTHAWPPPYGLWAKAPAGVHRVVGGLWAVIRRRRQLQAIAARSA